MNYETEIRARQAKIEDIPLLNELVNSAYRGESSKKGWTTEADLLGGQRTDPKFLEETLQAKENTILVFCQNDKLLGCVLLKKQDESAYLGMLTVRPDLQSSGLGRKILAVAEDWVLQSWGLKQIEMTVIERRIELIAWYERRGYLKTEERRPFPYGDERFGLPKVKGLEFIVLKKSLLKQV